MGKKHSADCAKLSEAKMGKKRSAERRAKMSEAMKGKKRSADHKVLLIAPRASSTADASRPRCEEQAARDARERNGLARAIEGVR